VIFIHSLGQPLIVRSHSKVHRCTAREEIPSKFPREPHVFPIIVTSLDSTDNKHGFQRQVRRCRRRRNFIYYIEYFRKAAGVLLLGAWCKNIQYDIPIITLVGVWPDGLSPLEKLGHPLDLTFTNYHPCWSVTRQFVSPRKVRSYPRVTLLFEGRQTVGSHSNKGDNCILP
jgi:hypothetical protein